ncbi:Hypothetical protein, putative [Bodo saltans]|uniref:XPC-binding domain-containing protein n=1 Tax=Bodo saltans TaxID=75058 RepID=A0A0S4K0N3_BODSA|nr:Hypothetical protein, putative [Bodo saltans]|eukprot:CUG94363.1 Hypothetical protein, putative [Bodo saltans]
MSFNPAPPLPPSGGSITSMSQVLLTFKTVANRACTLSIHRGRTTFAALLETVGTELGLRVPTIKLLRGTTRLQSIQDVFAAADDIHLAMSSSRQSHQHNSVLVVGSKALSPLTPPSTSSPHSQPELNSSSEEDLGDGSRRLRFPHVPNGLRELQLVISAPVGVTGTTPNAPNMPPSSSNGAATFESHHLGAVFDELASHPTMQHISELVMNAPNQEASEETLRRILLQIGSNAPALMRWIQQNQPTFLSLLNRAPNPFLFMSWDVLNDLRSMMEDMGIEVNGEATSVDVNENGEAVYVFRDDAVHPSATGEVHQTVVIVRRASDHEDDAGSHGTTHRVMGVDANPEEELATLEASLKDVEDVFLEASIHRELAISYQSLYQTVAGGRGDSGKVQYFESKTSQWFRKAVAAVVHAVQHVPMPNAAGGNDNKDEDTSVWTMQALCSLAPSCFVGAQLWFKGRDSMSSLAACIAHLTFWDVVETFNQQLSSMPDRHDVPPPAAVSSQMPLSGTYDDASSIVYSHPGTVRAASITSASSYGGGGRVDESVISTIESLADPFQETMRLMRYTQEQNTTLVLYSLVGPGSMLIYVLRGGKDIRIAQAPVAHDGFKGSMMFLEDALQRRRFGVNLNLLWTEHMSSMYAALVQPVEQWLPAAPSEVADVDCGQVCFIVSFSPVPLPFSSMLDGNGVPVIAKMAVFQAHVPTDIFVADSSPFLTPTAGTTMVLSESTPNWMTRQLARSLGASPMTIPARSGDAATILHVENVERFPMSALPLCDFFVCERFIEGMRYTIHRAALVRSMKIHPDNEGFAYEFGRTLYLTLSEGKTICRSVRAAVLATMSVFPLEPWVWGSSTLFNYGGPIPSLEHHAERQAKRAQRREIESQRLLRTNAAATPESRYADNMGVNTIYNAMVASLLGDRPDTIDGIEDRLIACLESFPPDFRSTRASSTTSRMSMPSSTIVVGKMMPAPPERPQGSKPAPPRSGQTNSSTTSSRQE